MVPTSGKYNNVFESYNWKVKVRLGSKYNSRKEKSNRIGKNEDKEEEEDDDEQEEDDEVKKKGKRRTNEIVQNSSNDYGRY